MDVLKNFLFPKIYFKRDIIRAKTWFPYGKCLLANNMTDQGDVRLCQLGGGWRLVKWMYQALFSPLSSQRNKEAKKKNAWSQVNEYGALSHARFARAGAPLQSDIQEP